MVSLEDLVPSTHIYRKFASIWDFSSLNKSLKSVEKDNNYKGYGYVEKSMQAIKHNEKANKLNRIKKYAKQRVDRLCYLSNSIKN